MITNGAGYLPKTSCCDYNGATDIVVYAPSIASYAFYGCNKIVSIKMPNSTIIGDYAFTYTTALESIDIPIVTTIGVSAFYASNKLETIAMPTVTTIGNSAFYGCTALQSVSMLFMAALHFNRYLCHQ